MTDDPHAAARTLLVAGTASHVGKSTVAAGLCRHLADAGVAVAPYKAQNMSNNARAVRTSPGADVDAAFGEVGVSQYVQARAARVGPETDHNPVLLKPRGEGESQLVVNGQAVAHASATDYYGDRWEEAREAAAAAHRRLAADHDVIVAEGAGSIAEINLRDRDLANVETARLFGDVDPPEGAGSSEGAEILLVADIERGGVFAALVGTLELLPADLRDRVVGAVVTKFRGDRSLLDPGIDAFEDRTGVPVLGVIPHDDPGLPEEDSVALPDPGERAIRGGSDGVADAEAVTVAVPRLPRISNATDVEPLAAEPGVRVAFVPLDADLEDVDAVVIPGTKNTVDDLRACREAGFDAALDSFDGPVIGLCGGYQLLGERITNADVESADRDAPGVVDGFGLLPVETAFSAEKRVVAAELRLDPERTDLVDSAATEPGAGDGRVLDAAGYEIHMGETTRASGAEPPSPGFSTPLSDPEGDRTGIELGAAAGDVLGTYLHGLFENDGVRRGFLARVRERSGIEDEPHGGTVDGDSTGLDGPADRAATLLREHVDLAALELPGDGDRFGPVR
ncbi:adenosylcobyric acid synthase (glutamine-hydrolysing) [Halorubrum aquaticum]|uniref:Probable cobyric acid synthase n=1 Tax=Halorubrum aquaticum TaxID=387340 RepID=A0A1I3C1H5_9EURY|nr:cobyric acid synthase [Halorubrum aquaticum]SFH68342.1 adenosylcobyric acid synthase (glutamine-hydrolysing) [Halorubrum aquaticum]